MTADGAVPCADLDVRAGGTVRRTAGRLADGRDILYFDETPAYVHGAATRDLLDTRPLAPARGGTRMRLDVLTGEWIPLAAHRMGRTHLPPREECPLCPTGRGTQPSEVPATDYDVVVFENRFPSLSTRDVAADSLVDGQSLWPERAAVGRCEVVCFTSDHNASFASLSRTRVRTVIEAWADRTRELSGRPDVEQVFAFENRGQEIGVTLHHPHGQIYAYPYVPPRTQRMLEQARTYRERTDSGLLRDVLDAERGSARRVVLAGDHWTAYVPVAARWPVEVHLAPHRDVPDLPSLDDAERDELAAMYQSLLRLADRFYTGDDGSPVALPYIAAWHQAPVRVGRDLARLHLQLFSVLRAPGKLKYLAGSESGLGAWVNDTTPELIADRFREIRL